MDRKLNIANIEARNIKSCFSGKGDCGCPCRSEHTIEAYFSAINGEKGLGSPANIAAEVIREEDLARTMKQTVRLFVYLRNIPNNDDGKIYLFLEIGSTSLHTQVPTDNPHFIAMFEVRTTLIDTLTFRVKECNMSRDMLVGKVRCTVEELRDGVNDNAFGYKKHDLERGGYIYVQTLTEEEHEDTLEFSVKALLSTKVFGKANPYFKLTLLDQNQTVAVGKSLMLYESEVAQNTLHPNWERISLPVKLLGLKRIGTPFILSMYDEDDGDEILVGTTNAVSFAMIAGYPVSIPIWKQRLTGGMKKCGQFIVTDVKRRSGR